MKWPLVLRKTHETKIEAFQKLVKTQDHTINYLRAEQKQSLEDLALANRAAQEIVPRLVKIQQPIRNVDFNTYSICADIHRDVVERAFTHGGDDKMIEWFAEQLAQDIKRKIIQFNFARCERR